MAMPSQPQVPVGAEPRAVLGILVWHGRDPEHAAGRGQEQPQLILSIVHGALFLEQSPFYYSIFL